jgi:hypothetical protein
LLTDQCVFYSPLFVNPFRPTTRAVKITESWGLLTEEGEGLPGSLAHAEVSNLTSKVNLIRRVWKSHVPSIFGTTTIHMTDRISTSPMREDPS